MTIPIFMVKVSELRQKSSEELGAMLRELREELVALQLRGLLGRKVQRKNIARVLTVLKEKA